MHTYRTEDYRYERTKEQGLFDTEGFKLSGIFIDRKENGCFKFECRDCGDVEYIMIPEWLQEEKNIKDKSMG
jgi:hypothetical protein